ncbi:unnamed protein product [Ambrosiozyma monospora]|uniref:Unnamed protein product n=1 Tax=Ambrosiozyma monospora TaxID=43982 RepID=A0A9W6YUC0_AMBMO|nr:unnamed protein product [Ambrosiozyma monospora]
MSNSGANVHPLRSITSHVHPIQSVHTKLHEVVSTQSAIREIDAKDAANDSDLLAQIGYKQELKRSFHTYQIFGIAYSIMGILPGISSMTAVGLTGGPSGFVWGWFVAMHFIMCISISMSELASSIPTSGGLYFWTYYYAPENYRVLFSYVIGLTNSMALCAGVVSVAYGNAEQILAAVYIQQDGNFEITSGKTYGIFAACVVTQCICTCFSSKSVATLQSISSILNTFLVILIVIAVPVGVSQKDFGFRSGKFIFGTVQNYSDWPIGFQFCLSLMTAVWSIGAFDSCVHMSEEAQNASFGVPIGILSSVSVVSYVSWFVIICLVACMKPDVGAVLETGSGFPFAQLIFDALGKKWTVAIMSLIAVGQWLCAASILTALSRQVWAFARDDGLPFSSIVKVVHPTLKVPIRAVLFATCVALALGCLCLAGSAASNALFSLTISGNYTAWCTPVLLRLTSD